MKFRKHPPRGFDGAENVWPEDCLLGARQAQRIVRVFIDRPEGATSEPSKAKPKGVEPPKSPGREKRKEFAADRWIWWDRKKDRFEEVENRQGPPEGVGFPFGEGGC